MKLIAVTDRTAWDDFQSAQPYSQFLQSWAWGEFRIAEGKTRVLRFVLLDERRATHDAPLTSDWLLAVQLEFCPRRFGLGYWFAARGPVFRPGTTNDERRTAMFALCEELSRLAELKKQTLFWRFEPLVRLEDAESLMPLSFFRTHAMNPATSAILDLSPSEEDVQKRMHEKTRYNIRVAARHGVTTRFAQNDTDIAAFLDLVEETARRDGFTSRSRAYVEATYRSLAKEGMARIRLAEWQGNILAANLEITFGDTVTYLYGSSSSQDRNVMAPFALHWDAIRDAKAKGLRFYDFGGANPQAQGMFYFKKSWEGITRFKKSWGADCQNFVGTWDLPMNRLLYRIAFYKEFFRG